MSPSSFSVPDRSALHHCGHSAPSGASGRAKPPPRPPAPPPAPCGVGPFAPLRVRGGGAYRLRRILRRRRRTLATGLALAGAALATTGGLSSAGSGPGTPEAAASDTASPGTGVSGMPVPGAAAVSGAASDTAVGAGHPSARLVSAPVRIADAATVRLLRPGDRVDVIAVGEAGDDARLVARDVRVARVPGGPAAGAPAPDGALVMLSVERSTATALLGAGAAGRLAVAVSDAN
ncbi:hypothetical protein ACFU67_03510 [Streptomyces rhizosphaericola]|uniref:hypothetical protein n=1 Tax=Streptomyces TaxID=1883 RepID=UPI000A6127A6|nr:MULTISPECIES: hypothetical protein [unclassified Streptomyces]